MSLGVDIALAYFIARLIFRRSSAAMPFVLLLAIASDALGFLALALFDSGRNLHLVEGALIMAAAVGAALALRRVAREELLALPADRGVSSPGQHCSGAACIRRSHWCRSCPSCRMRRAIADSSSTHGPKARDALSQFEIWWRYPAQVTLFLFGLVNAGVPFHALEPGTWGLPIALLVGRPARYSGRRGRRARLPPAPATRRRLARTDRRRVYVAIGFSVGLFFSTRCLPPGQLRAEPAWACC